MHNCKPLKTSLLILLSISLFSCTKKENDNSIYFDSQLTKAIVSNVDHLKASGISIFGIRTPGGGDAYANFNNRHLSFSSSWNYDGYIEYWIPGSTYNFFALFPYSADAYSFSLVNKTVTFDYTSALTADQRDVLYSTHSRTYVEDGDDSAVSLSMNHTTASLLFRVRNVSQTTISISAISLTGLYNNGTCTVGTSSVSWNTTGSILAADDDDTYPGVNSGLTNLPASVDTYHNLFSSQILVVPQQVQHRSDIKLKLTVTPQVGDPFNIVAELANTGAITSWVPNTNYTYTLSITEDRILFEETLNDWVEDEIEL